MSCINGHVRIVKRLLEEGADVRVDKLYEDDEGRWSIRGNCLVLSALLGQEYVINYINIAINMHITCED